MRRPLIAGNWKMNTDINDGRVLSAELVSLIDGNMDVEVIIAPPFPSLSAVCEEIKESPIRLAAQNLHYEESGAWTGEVSGGMLRAAGCKYVIVGHSERRQFFGDTNETVNKKAHAALKAGLKAIVCVGESLDQREEGHAIETVTSQAKLALQGFSGGMMREVVIAYEPVWAIGTGRTASPADAEEVHSAIRTLLFDTFEMEAAEGVRILYGGSVKPDNVDSLMAEANIDGALVGGASLKAESFARIVAFRHP